MSVEKQIARLQDKNQARAAIIDLLLLNEADSQLLFAAANRVCLQELGSVVHFRAIIEFSNYCRCACKYCGLRATNRQIARYRMTPEEIMAAATEAYQAGYRTIVLQSGEDAHYSAEMLYELIRSIKQIGDMAITLSIGERSDEEFAILKHAGADRFLMKHETANAALYRQLHPHSELQFRLNHLRALKRLGYQLGSGFMIGLPGQTAEHIADDILLLQSMEVDMAGIGPFIPHSLTPLCDHPAGSSQLTLKAVAITRLLLRKIHLPATTALGVAEKGAKERALSCGANVIMLKVEPHKYRSLYEIYPNSSRKLGIQEERDYWIGIVAQLGRTVAEDKGDSRISAAEKMGGTDDERTKGRELYRGSGNLEID